MESNDTRLNIGELDPFSAAGLSPGVPLPLARLQELQERSGFGVYLYFDEHLARTSTLDADIRDFRIVPPQARPFMPLQEFVRIMSEVEADFLHRMQEEPLMVEVVETGTLDRSSGCVLCRERYVKGLLL